MFKGLPELFDNLGNSKLIEESAEKHYDAITKLAAYICKTKNASINLIADQKLLCKSKIGFDLCNLNIEDSLCKHVISSRKLLIIEDALANNQYNKSLVVTAETRIRFYAGLPLINSEGYLIGTLCVFDDQPAPALDNQQQQALEFLANEVVLRLETDAKNQHLQQLNKTNEDFLELFNNSSELHMILDLKGNINYANQSVNRLLGFEKEDLVGKNIWNFCSPGSRELILATLKQTPYQEQEPFALDIQMITKSNQLRWFSWCNVKVNNRWLINGRDVHLSYENKRLNEKLSLVASHINSGVVINDENNQIVWINKAFEKITGYNFDAIKGKKLRNVLAGADTNLEVLNYAAQQVDAKQSFKIELNCYRANGTAVWLSVMNSIIEEENQQQYRSVEIITNISEKKKADEELQMLSMAVKKADVGVLIRNDKGQIIWLNEAFEKILGYQFNELAGVTLNKEFLGPETNLDVFYAAKENTSRKIPYDVEIVLYTKAGKPIWVSIYTSFLFDDNGNISKQLSIVTDITVRKNAEQELINTREEALKLSRAKENFISVISHEIRTPVNSIIGMSGLLLDEHPQPYQLENLENLKFSSENLLVLVNDILDFTKIETGNMKLEAAPVNLKELAKRTLQSLEFKRENDQVKLTLEADDQIPDIILADSTRIYQILINLLGNAVKFTAQGEVKLKLSLTEKNDDEITVHFIISDTGIGIENNKQQAVFEAYKQASTDTTRKFGGTGLGLTITKKLIEIHGSSINIESELGHGTSFFFDIQFKTIKADVEHSNTAKNFADLPSKVLVVDDNHINRILAKKVLSKWAIEVSTAENGLQAFEMISQNEYDLVLMDVHMPVMGGVEATKNIRSLNGERFKKLPIIALTGSVFGFDLDNLSKDGITDYFIKPYTPEGLYHKIKPYLQPQNA